MAWEGEGKEEEEVKCSLACGAWSPVWFLDAGVESVSAELKVPLAPKVAARREPPHATAVLLNNLLDMGDGEKESEGGQ